jgi:hypothetical protein
LLVVFVLVALGAARPGFPAPERAGAIDCSAATARQLVDRFQLNSFGLPNPVSQFLCGAFTGPGSEAMAITIKAPTCWPVQQWAVASVSGGQWRLVLNQPAYLIPPLQAVGSDIREETAVSRSATLAATRPAGRARGSGTGTAPSSSPASGRRCSRRSRSS